MQTEPHTGTRSSWPEWAEFLRSHGLESMASWVLEAFGPLAVVGAQILHAGSPLINLPSSNKQVESLTSLLEDPAETRAFAAYLREDVLP
jgi:hypothetical protein